MYFLFILPLLLLINIKIIFNEDAYIYIGFIKIKIKRKKQSFKKIYNIMFDIYYQKGYMSKLIKRSKCDLNIIVGVNDFNYIINIMNYVLLLQINNSAKILFSDFSLDEYNIVNHMGNFFKINCIISFKIADIIIALVNYFGGMFYARTSQ